MQKPSIIDYLFINDQFDTMFESLRKLELKTIIIICLIASNVVFLTLYLVNLDSSSDSNIYSAVEFHNIDTKITHPSNLTSDSCSWVPYMNEPVISPTLENESAGDAGNLYAPDVLIINGKYWMWYGAQDENGHDQIHFATSDDGIHWIKHGVVVPNNENNHVNDPSVVIANGTYYMFYTTAPEGINDVISLATSENGWNWTIVGNVLLPEQSLDWEKVKVGRPTVLYQEDKFKMWYDGTAENGYRTVGYAESVDGITWHRFENNPIVSYPLGAIDVDYIGNTYYMVCESRNGVLWTYSDNETDFGPLAYLFKKTDLSWDKYGHVTPFILNQNDSWTATYVGVTTDSCWCQNRIGIWYPTNNISIYNDEDIQIVPDNCYMNSKTSLLMIIDDSSATKALLNPDTSGDWSCSFEIQINDTNTIESQLYTIFKNAQYYNNEDQKIKNMFVTDKKHNIVIRL